MSRRASTCPTVVKLASNPTRLTLAWPSTLARASDIFPSLTAAYTDPYFAAPDPYFGDQEVRKFFADLIPSVPAATVYSSDYAVMNASLSSAIQRFAMGELSAKDALAAAAQEIRDKTGRP